MSCKNLDDIISFLCYRRYHESWLRLGITSNVWRIRLLKGVRFEPTREIIFVLQKAVPRWGNGGRDWSNLLFIVYGFFRNIDVKAHHYNNSLFSSEWLLPSCLFLRTWTSTVVGNITHGWGSSFLRARHRSFQGRISPTRKKLPFFLFFRVKSLRLASLTSTVLSRRHNCFNNW